MERKPIFNPEGARPERPPLDFDRLEPGGVIKLVTPHRYVQLEVTSTDERLTPDVLYRDARNDEAGIESVEWATAGRAMRLGGHCPRIKVVEGQTQLIDAVSEQIVEGDRVWLVKADGEIFVTGPVDDFTYEPS